MHAATHGSDAQVQWASGLNVIAGLWLIIAPFVLGFSGNTAATWNDVIFGIAIAIIGAIRAAWLHDQAWLSWVNLILGAWVFVSVWVLSFANLQMALWNNLVLGVIVFILAGVSALGSQSGAGTLTPQG